jgi:outer membrane protein assembly factor BamB
MLTTRRAGAQWVLCLALILAACSGGGGGNNTPVLPWGRFRAGVANTGFASGGLANNHGDVAPVLLLGPNVQVPGIDGLPVRIGGITGSTPIISTDDNDLIYLGTTAGLLATSKDATRVRVFDECTFQGETVSVGTVSGTPAINLNNDIVFGDDNGRIFALNDDGTIFTCLWVYPAPTAAPIPDGVVSSPLILSDANDFSLVTAIVGVGSGHVQALNTFGTSQWRFPDGDSSFPKPLTSSVCTDGVSFHITAPDGFLYSLDRVGRLQHHARVSLATDGIGLLASPMSGTSTYAVGVGGRCGTTTDGCLEQSECPGETCTQLGEIGTLTALTPLDEVRWRFGADAPIAGSAFVLQSVDEVAPPRATPTPSTTPPTPDPNPPTPTPTAFAVVIEGIVYLVDTSGTVYGVKDVSGDLFVAVPTAQTATPTPTLIPGEDTPMPLPTSTPGAAQPKPAKVQLEDAVNVTSSPALSTDLFVVFGTDRGELYAIRLDFDRTIPCEDCDASGRKWDPVPFVDNQSGGGKIILPGGKAVVSSPIIDHDGTIYVTAGDVSAGEGILFSVGSQ